MRGAALVLGLLISAFGAGAEPPGRCVDAVDPFIGTRGMGHTYPGATAPFGMVQLSPDTDVPPYSLDGRTYNPAACRACAGYQAVRLNGRPWNRAVLRHADVVQGGELVFELGPRPNRRWAAGPEARPYSLPLEP